MNRKTPLFINMEKALAIELKMLSPFFTDYYSLLILGMKDRVIGAECGFYASSGGENTITGGVGADQFWIAVAEIPDSANMITDFMSGEDVIGIAGLGIGFEDLSIAQQQNNTLIAVNGLDLAVLKGIGADSLSADNFAFI